MTAPTRKGTSKQRLTLLFSAGILIISGITAYGFHLKYAWHFAMILTHVSIIQGNIKAHVGDYRAFPKTIDEISEEYKINPDILNYPEGIKYTYTQPKPDDPDDVPIFTLTYRSKTIVVLKDFSRQVIR